MKIFAIAALLQNREESEVSVSFKLAQGIRNAADENEAARIFLRHLKDMYPQSSIADFLVLEVET